MVEVKGLPQNLPVSDLLFTFVPLIAASILVYREERLDGLRRLLERVFDYKRIEQKFWYLPIIFLMPLLYLLTYGVMRLMGLPLPADRSVFAAILFHAMANVGKTVFPGDVSHYDPAVGYSIIAITAVMVTVLWGPRTLTRYSRVEDG
jgi:hypothetical protein